MTQVCIRAGEYPKSSDWGTRPSRAAPHLPSRPPHAPPSDTHAARSLPPLQRCLLRGPHTLNHTPKHHPPEFCFVFLHRIYHQPLFTAVTQGQSARAHSRPLAESSPSGSPVQAPLKAPFPATGALNATTAPLAVVQPTYSHTNTPWPRTEKQHRLSYSCTVNALSLPSQVQTALLHSVQFSCSVVSSSL